jgi:hypothetical protein
MTWIVEFEIINNAEPELELKGKFESDMDTPEETMEELDEEFMENEVWDLIDYDRSIKLGDHELVIGKVYPKT